MPRCDAVCHCQRPGGQRVSVAEFAANDQRRDVVPVYPERLNDFAVRGAETVPGRWMCRCGKCPGAEESLRRERTLREGYRRASSEGMPLSPNPRGNSLIVDQMAGRRERAKSSVPSCSAMTTTSDTPELVLQSRLFRVVRRVSAVVGDDRVNPWRWVTILLWRMCGSGRRSWMRSLV